MSSESRQTSQSESSSDPWAPAQPMLRNAAGRIDRFLGNENANAVYDGERYAGMGDMTRDGYERLANNGGFEQSRDYYEGVLRGDHMSPSNPHLQNLQNSISASVMPGVNSVFSSSGMTGSSAHQGVLTRAMTDGMARPLFNLHESERQRQERAAGVLPQLYGQDAAARIQAGQAFDQDRQNQLNTDRQLWEEQRLAPVRGVMDMFPYMTGLGQMGSESTSSTTQTQRPSDMQTAIGIGSAVGGMAMNAFAPGMGSMMGMMGSMGGGMGGGNPWMSGGPMAHPYMR